MMIVNWMEWNCMKVKKYKLLAQDEQQSVNSDKQHVVLPLVCRVCLSVCHKLVFYRNSWTDQTCFWHRSYLYLVLHSVGMECRCLKACHYELLSTYAQTKFSEQAFLYSEPATWNRLPHDVHAALSRNVFKRKLKIRLFIEDFVTL